MNSELRDRCIEEFIEWWYNRFPVTEYNYYIISIMFKNIPGREDVILQRMEIETNDLCRKLITRLNRKPNSVAKKRFNPQFVIYPDLPVPKSDKSSLIQKTLANEGLHLQGICAIPNVCRLKEDISTHTSRNKSLYTPKYGLIDRIHFELITKKPSIVIKYVFKQFKMARFDLDNFIYLPKCSTEMPSF